MRREVYNRYLRKISDIEPIIGAIKAAVNIADINREIFDEDLDKKPSGDIHMPCSIHDNCKTDGYMSDRDYEGRGMLLQLGRALQRK